MPLSTHLKNLLNGLASAHVADHLSLTQKDAVLSGLPKVSRAPEAVAPAATAERTRIALYLGGDLPGEVMQYVLRTCVQLRYGLTVFTLQSRKEAEALLDGYRDALAESGIAPQLVTLSSEPSRALSQALRRRPEIAFLVCNESGYLGRGLLNGTQHVLPVPVVLVSQDAGRGEAQRPAGQDSSTTRAA